MARNYEHEAIWDAAWEALFAASLDLMPPEPMGVETPIARAERAFAADGIADAYTGPVLGALAGELDSLVDDATKPRKAGLRWAVQVLMGENA